MLKYLGRLWRSYQRKFDLQVLWPICKESANGDLNLARAAFAMHCSMDTAWTRDFTAEGLLEYIDNLQ